MLIYICFAMQCFSTSSLPTKTEVIQFDFYFTKHRDRHDIAEILLKVALNTITTIKHRGNLARRKPKTNQNNNLKNPTGCKLSLNNILTLSFFN